MPNIFEYDTTAANNTSVGGVSIAEGMPPGDVNNAMRAMMADTAAYSNCHDGAISTTGSANAYVYASGMSLSAYANGQRITIRANFTNTGAATIDVDSVGAGDIKIARTDGIAALYAGAIRSAGIYDLAYSETNTAWMLLNPSNGTEPFANGSAAAPSITFTNSLDSGFYRYADNEIGVSADGTAVARFDTSGLKVGKLTTDLTSAGASINRNTTSSFSTNDEAVLRLNRDDSNGNELEFYREGNFVAAISVTTTTVTYGTSSDPRLKMNFRDFDSGAILDAIRMYQFEWRDGSGTAFGPNAIELYGVFPNAVARGSEEGEPFMPWAWDAGKLMPVAIRELQELRKRVAALEAALG